MKIKNKDKFYQHLWFYRYLWFLSFESDIKDSELQTILKALSIKSRYKRFLYIVEETCDYIDRYYEDCNLCHFKNNKCVCHRKQKKKYINGCCRKCRFQSNNGCTTKNVACKLFLCSYADLNEKEKLNAKDIKVLRLLGPFQRYMICMDYFQKPKTVALHLYFNPVSPLILFIILTILLLVY